MIHEITERSKSISVGDLIQDKWKNTSVNLGMLNSLKLFYTRYKTVIFAIKNNNC